MVFLKSQSIHSLYRVSQIRTNIQIQIIELFKQLIVLQLYEY